MTERVDVHVNLIPDWARGDATTVDLSGETPSLIRAYSHPRAGALNKLCAVEAILSAMDTAGIRRALCFSYQWRNSDRCRSGNEVVLKAVNDHPDRLLGLAVVQPHEPSAVVELDRLLAEPHIIGLKMKPKWGGFALSDTKLLGPLCEVLLSRRGILLTHISQNFHQSEGDHLGDLMVLLRAFPKLTVVAAHLGGFAGVYGCYPAVGRHFENLFIDISLPANLRWLPALMRIDDARRYVYATDFPYATFDEFDRELERVGLSDNEIEMLTVENPRFLLARAGIGK